MTTKHLHIPSFAAAAVQAALKNAERAADNPTRRDGDPPQHHIQRLPRAGDHPAAPATRHPGSHHRARRRPPPAGILAAEGHRRLLLPRHRRLLHPLPHGRGGGAHRARRPPRSVSPAALINAPGGPSSARAAPAALRPSGAELTPPDPSASSSALALGLPLPHLGARRPPPARAAAVDSPAMPCAGLLLLAMLALAAPAAATPVRMFAVGHKVRLDDGTTYQSFHDKMAALMDAGFPDRASLVQAGVDDVASHLFPADPAAPATVLVVFPEDVGLVAALIGSRGAAARAQISAVGAIAALFAPYAVQYDYYNAKYPGQPLVRPLVLALTDTVYRGFYETFRELALTHGVYLAASFNAAPARRVEQATEPDLVALLRDPDEPSRTYAYEAVSPFPYNTTLVFAPDGEVLVPDGNGGTLESPSATGGVIRGSANKAYLTPIEQPPPGNQAGLSLAFGPVHDLEVLDTPVGRLAIVISKDAWMIDVNDRFLAKGANVVLQPEAFSEWAYAAAPWQPNIFKEGGFANLEKHVPWVANVDASMTGNFFDVTFDGQSAVLGRKRKTSPGPLGPGHAWIGQNPDTGFRIVAPWIEPDPGIANPALTLAERRAMLAADGAQLLPGSGAACGGSLEVGACENGYREPVVFADVDLPAGATTAPVDPTIAPPPRP